LLLFSFSIQAVMSVEKQKIHSYKDLNFRHSVVAVRSLGFEPMAPPGQASQKNCNPPLIGLVFGGPLHWTANPTPGLDLP
jgi:hypothetical protein